MTRIIYNKYDKTKIKDLPRVIFEGRIDVVINAEEAKKAVDYLLSRPILGVDTETRPSFTKGNQHLVSLLQVSDYDICFLFRLNSTGITPDIKRLLEDKSVPKIGLSLQDDMMSLHRMSAFKPGNFIDLQNHVKELGVEDLSLQKLYANFFHQKISKAQRLSNWEADILTDKQKRYAATDAWTCINLYEEYMKMKSSGDYELIKMEDEKEELSVNQ